MYSIGLSNHSCKPAMKKQTILVVFVAFLFSLACQLLFPTASNRDGTIIDACADLVKAVREVQPTNIPPTLLETGIKQGDEFDVNEYFNAFTHISVQEGYAFDYVYQLDSLASYRILYARLADQPAYVTTNDLTLDLNVSD